MNNLKKEDGYILIVIVGILTVFSLMAVTFATLSRIETKAARNYADSVKCEAVAKAGLEHALYTIRLDKFGTDTTVYNDDSGGDTNYDSPNDASWPGDGVFDGADYDNDGDSTTDSRWVYFPATVSTTDIRLPGNLRARYAVLITDDREARVNINVTGNKAGGLSHASNEGWSTFEIDLSKLIEQPAGLSSADGDDIASAIIDRRLGNDLNPGNAGDDDDPGKIPDPQDDAIDNDGNSIIDEAGEETNEPNEFNSISPIGDDVPFGLLSEAEIMGTSTYMSRLEEIFDDNIVFQDDQDTLKGWLTTYSADTILCPEYQLDGVGTSTKLNINALIYNEGAYAGATSDRKVAMIIDVLTAGGVPPVQRQQMAVNIKDFIDTDSAVTTYWDGTDIYYGVERTPYINEVEAKPGGDEFIELYNPYDTTIDIGDWTITGPSLGTVTITGGAQILADGYYVIADGGAIGQIVPGMNLVDGGEELTLTTDPGSGSITVQVTDYGSASGNKNRTRELNDPRPIPLTATPSNPWSWSTSSINDDTVGARNDGFDPAGIGDNWTLGTYPSSFFIANRRFSNKGYLGYIHRGSEWSSFDVRSTINYPDVLQYITITDPSMDNIDNDGDGDIDAADTGAQVGDVDGQEYRIPGLINVNTAPTEVLASLPNGLDGTLGNAIAIAIQGSISKPFKNIGDLVKNVSQITGAGSKWAEEQRFRSISNLITTRSNVFTVYVTAQVTEDDITDPPNTKVFAEKRIMAIVDRSVDPIRVRYFRWIVE